jgi:hypothetical protein
LASLDNKWDVFVGLTADFDFKTNILDVQEFQGKRFIHTNKFTSMVFNIYSRSGLRKLASWKAEDSILHLDNTIDRFLNQDSSLRVICMDRDVFGHEGNLSSTIWGHSNTEYDSMIIRSHYIKIGLMHEWIENSRGSF